MCCIFKYQIKVCSLVPTCNHSNHLITSTISALGETLVFYSVEQV